MASGGIQRGHNRSGLNGVLIDLPFLTRDQLAADDYASAADPNAKAAEHLNGIKFHGDCYKWGFSQDVSTRARLGRGGDGQIDYRPLAATGGGVIGNIREIEADWPQPDAFKGQRGTITHYIHIGDTDAKTNVPRKITKPIMVTKYELGIDVESKEKGVVGKLTYVDTGPAVFEGWNGDQPQATEPAKSDLQLYEGTFFTLDPKGLASAGQITIDWWGDIADSDEAEIAKLGAAFASVAIPAGFKLRPGTISRNASDGGTITLKIGLTSTEDDWVNEHTQINVDPNKMQTNGTVAAINADPALPTVPGQTIVERFTTKYKINDNKEGRAKTFAQRDTQEDVTMEGTQARVDKSGIVSEGIDTKVFPTGSQPPDDATPPDASLKVVATTIQEVNRDENKKVTYFEVNDEIEKWVYARTKISIDPSLLKDVTVLGATYTRDADTPDAPTVAGLVLRDTTYFDITSPDTSNRKGVLWTYSQTTEADDELFPKLRTETDPQGIDTNKITGAFFTTGSPPVDPSTPIAGLKLSNKSDLTLTNAAASNQSLRLYRWEKQDSLDKIKNPKFSTTVDANLIDDKATRIKEWFSNATPPTQPDDVPTNNVKFLDYEDAVVYQANVGAPGLYVRTFFYGARDSRDELILPNYETTTDGSDLASTATRAYLEGEAVPTTPAGLVLRDTKKRPITIGLATDKTLVVLIYGKDSRKQEWENKNSQVYLDDFSLESKAQSAAIDNVSPPPISGGGLLRVGQRTEKVTHDHAGYIDEYDTITPPQKATFPKIEIRTDPRSLKDYAELCELYPHGSSPPPLPTIDDPPAGTKLIGRADFHYKNAWDMRVWVYAKRNTRDEITLDHFRTVTDASGLESIYVDAYIQGDTPPTPPAGFVLRDTDVRTLAIADTTGDDPDFLGADITVNIRMYGLVSRQQEIEDEETEIENSPIDAYHRKITTLVTIADTVSTSAAADSLFGTIKNDLTVDSLRLKRRTKTKALKSIIYSGEDQKRHSATARTWLDDFRGQPELGFDAADAWDNPSALIKVNVPGAFVGGPGGFEFGYVQPIFQRRNVRTFMVRRRFITTTPRQPEDFYFLDKIGKTNDDIFLGIPKHQCMYDGPIPLYNGSTLPGTGADNHLVVVDFQFTVDSLMHINAGNLPGYGKVWVYDTGNLLTSSGLYPASIFSTAAGVYGLIWPDETGFGAFGIV